MSNPTRGGGYLRTGGSRSNLKVRRSSKARKSSNPAQQPNSHNGTVSGAYKQVARTWAATHRPKAGRVVKGQLRG